MRGIRALLVAVIAMGILIVAGTGVLIGTVAYRAIHRGSPARPPVATLPDAEAIPALVLTQPPGTRIGAVTRQSDALLAVTLTGGGLSDRVLLWDPISARIVARLGLER